MLTTHGKKKKLQKKGEIDKKSCWEYKLVSKTQNRSGQKKSLKVFIQQWIKHD